MPFGGAALHIAGFDGDDSAAGDAVVRRRCGQPVVQRFGSGVDEELVLFAGLSVDEAEIGGRRDNLWPDKITVSASRFDSKSGVHIGFKFLLAWRAC
jgi:hypothetical protein